MNDLTRTIDVLEGKQAWASQTGWAAQVRTLSHMLATGNTSSFATPEEMRRLVMQMPEPVEIMRRRPCRGPYK